MIYSFTFTIYNKNVNILKENVYMIFNLFFNSKIKILLFYKIKQKNKKINYFKNLYRL